MNMGDFRRRLLESGVASERSLRGCASAEVGQFETSLSLRLPETYRAFLLLMGHAAGDLFRGEDTAFGALGRLRQAARDEAAAAGWALPSDAVVILGHQGFRYYFLRAEEGEDPPVHVFEEGDAGPSTAAPAFSAFLEAWLAEAASVGPLPPNVEFLTLEELEKRRREQ